MGRDAGMVSFIGEKWRDSSGGIRSIIISKFCDGEQIRPIVLLVVAVYLEVLLQGLIHSFGLSITFRMITGGEVEFHVQQAFPNVWKNDDTNSEPWSEVTCNGTPCFEKTWSTSWASMGAVMVLTVGTNMDCLVS